MKARAEMDSSVRGVCRSISLADRKDAGGIGQGNVAVSWLSVAESLVALLGTPEHPAHVRGPSPFTRLEERP